MALQNKIKSYELQKYKIFLDIITNLRIYFDKYVKETAFKMSCLNEMNIKIINAKTHQFYWKYSYSIYYFKWSSMTTLEINHKYLI